MNNLQGRVARLERATGEPGDGRYCQCLGDARVVVSWATREPEEPETCPRCGRPIRVDVVTWLDDDDRAEASDD